MATRCWTLPGIRVGKAGIEKFHDANLRGRRRHRQLEVNSVGRVIRELTGDEGQPGRDVSSPSMSGSSNIPSDGLEMKRAPLRS